MLEARDVRDAVLIGHSMGGGEMVRYLTRHGKDRIRKIVFVATAATPFAMTTKDYDEGPTRAELDYFRNEIVLGDYQKWMMENQAPFFLPGTSPMTQDWLVQMLLRTSLVAIYQTSETVSATDFRAELGKVSVPALVIHGDKDVSAPLVRGQRTAAMIPGARLVVYEGAPHGIFVTHARRLRDDIERFAAS